MITIISLVSTVSIAITAIMYLLISNTDRKENVFKEGDGNHGSGS